MTFILFVIYQFLVNENFKLINNIFSNLHFPLISSFLPIINFMQMSLYLSYGTNSVTYGCHIGQFL